MGWKLEKKIEQYEYKIVNIDLSLDFEWPGFLKLEIVERFLG